MTAPTPQTSERFQSNDDRIANSTNKWCDSLNVEMSRKPTIKAAPYIDYHYCKRKNVPSRLYQKVKLSHHIVVQLPEKPLIVLGTVNENTKWYQNRPSLCLCQHRDPKEKHQS